MEPGSSVNQNVFCRNRGMQLSNLAKCHPLLLIRALHITMWGSCVWFSLGVLLPLTYHPLFFSIFLCPCRRPFYLSASISIGLGICASTQLVRDISSSSAVTLWYEVSLEAFLVTWSDVVVLDAADDDSHQHLVINAFAAFLFIPPDGFLEGFQF